MTKDNTNIIITKASGDKEYFDKEKLINSLKNAGASQKQINHVISDVDSWIYSGVTTKKIYSKAFSILNKEKTIASLKYKLKKAIFDLGPSGYPFEYLIARVFEKQGYKVEVGQNIRGLCVSHEVDVIATKGSEQNIIECKFGQSQGKHISVQTPLYVRSRVDDIIKKRLEQEEYKNFHFKGWVVTNTRFSSDSIEYANCAGLNLLAWDYPQERGLKELIEMENIFPITILNHINKSQIVHLMDMGVVTCAQLLENKEAIASLSLKRNTELKLIKELKAIC